MIARLGAALRSVREPLYLNAYALVANQVSSAGLGFLYWLLAARLYGVDVVGGSSAAISTLLLVSALAQLGLGAGMNRFLPRAGRHARRLILSSYAVIVIASAAVAVGFLWASRLLDISDEIARIGTNPVLIVLAAVLWSVFYFQDSVLIGLRRSVWVFIENQLYNVAKILLLVAGVGLLGRYGIVGSWFLPTPLVILLVTWLIFTRFMRVDRVTAEPLAGDRLTVKEIVTSVTGDHVGTLVAETSVRLLPLIVLSLLGVAANAYFYQAWMVATMLTLIASGMCNSFTAEAAGDRGNIGFYSRGILRQMAIILLPVAVLIGVGAPIVLSLFGRAYADAASTLLRLLALAVPLVIFNTWYLNYARVVGRIRKVISLQALSSVLLVVLSYPALRIFGIAGVGMAWIVGQAAVTAISAPDARRALALTSSTQTGVGERLRRADWRFLLPQRHFGKAASFVPEGTLASSIGAVSDEVVAGLSPGANGCDVAVLADPDANDLEAAFRSLRPGGSCYSEWTTWRSGGARGVKRRLEAAGFEDVAVHWPVPGFDETRLWIAMLPHAERTQAAARHLIQSSMSSRPIRALAGIATDIVVRSGVAPALSVVGRRPGGTSPGPDSFARWLAERIADAEGVDADEMTLVMRTGGGDLGSKVNWPVFLGDEAEPRWVAKVGRHEVAAISLRQEQEVLRRLAERREKRGVIGPRLVHWSEDGGMPVLVQTALHGPSLQEVSAKTPFPDIARRMTSDLSAFAGRPAAHSREIWWDRLVEPHLERLSEYLDQFGEPELIPAVRGALDSLGPMPLVWVHNDCSPWNALVVDEGLALFDWEDGQPQGLPCVDLVYCLSTIAFTKDGTANTPLAIRSYRRLLDPGDELGAVFDRSLQDYAAKVGVDSRYLAGLRTATWLVHATQDLANILRANREVSSKLLEGSSCLPLLRAEAEAAGMLTGRPSGVEAPAVRPTVALGSAVFVSPHLDDAVLSCGSAIRRLTTSGADVTVVNCCTEDVPSGRPLSQLARCSHMSWSLYDRPFARRRDEDAAALDRLGAKSLHLGMHDAMYRMEEPGGRPLYGKAPIVARVHPEDLERFLPLLCERLAPIIDSDPRSRVFCPAGVGGHADHVLVRRAVERLCDRSRIVYYEEYPYSSRPGALRLVPKDDGPRWLSQTLSPTTEELESRIEAIACYRSQLRGLFPSVAERLLAVLAAWVTPAGRWLLGRIDFESSTARMARRVMRDVTVTGGERYWWAAGVPSPFD